MIGLAESDALCEVGSAKRFVGVGELKLRPGQLIRAVEEEPLLEGLGNGKGFALRANRCTAKSAICSALGIHYNIPFPVDQARDPPSSIHHDVPTVAVVVERKGILILDVVWRVRHDRILHPPVNEEGLFALPRVQLARSDGVKEVVKLPLVFERDRFPGTGELRRGDVGDIAGIERADRVSTRVLISVEGACKTEGMLRPFDVDFGVVQESPAGLLARNALPDRISTARSGDKLHKVEVGCTMSCEVSQAVLYSPEHYWFENTH